jgi:hypothetical protein
MTFFSQNLIFYLKDFSIYFETDGSRPLRLAKIPNLTPNDVKFGIDFELLF